MDPYRIIETLATGGGTTVYRAVRNADRRPVVLKVLDPRGSRPKDLKQLKHEYEIERLFDTPAVVTPLALETWEGMPALVLDDFGGHSLDRLLGAPMALDRFLHIAINIAGAVAEIHDRGVIHKDLKPVNIIVNPAIHEVKIADFGLASRLPRESRRTEPARLVEGSLPYIAPEQTGRTSRAIDRRADLYSLGVTFHQMLTGKLPFEAKDPVEWVHCHIALAPPDASEIVPDVPEAVARIVLKLLSKAPEDRYQSARGLRLDLERCLAEWSRHKRIEPFTPGEHDEPDQLQIPKKLYGRDAEIARLREALGRVVGKGAPELVLVSGYSGIGKSALVRELEAPVAREGGFFLPGKFDQYKRDIPYVTLVQAFRELVLRILAESEDRIAAWRQRLLGALGVNAQLIVDVIPQVELVVGRHPAPPELPPTEAQNRFRLVLRRFLGVFADRGRPLVLFLDDLQWADLASLGLLGELLTHAEVRDLLIIGAYRDNEVSASHPLMLHLAEARKAGARVSDIVLGPIPPAELAAFVAEALHCTVEDAVPLADLVQHKTAGNPFFAIQFLTALDDERLIERDARSRRWRWDLARIRAKGFTDNVVDLMVEKVRRLPPATQEALERLACLGNTAEIALLAKVRGGSEDESHADLWEAVRAGLVVRSDEVYEFVHDRIQEAAYSLIPEGQRAAMHLGIGRLLASRTPASELEERIFEIAGQLDRGAALITSRPERERVAELNLVAGKRARRATAYASALTYLATGATLLGEDRWERRYELSFELEVLWAECEYLIGNFEQAGTLFDRVLSHSRDKLERARVHVQRMQMYQVAGKFRESVDVMLEAVRPFGVTFPDTDEEQRAVMGAELRDVAVNLRGRAIADLVDAPLAEAPEVRALIGLLVAATGCAYSGRPALFPLIVLKALNLSLLRGNTEDSCQAYSVYGAMLVSALGDIPSGYEFSEMALRLNEKLGGPKDRGPLLYVHVHFIHFWRRPFWAGFPMMERVLSACLDFGHHVFARYHAFHVCWQTLELGTPLDEVLEVSRKYAGFVAQMHADVIHHSIRLLQRFVASLQGFPHGPAGSSDSALDEPGCLAPFIQAKADTGIALFHITKQIAAFVFGRLREAEEAARHAEEMLGGVLALPAEATHHFYRALTLAALHGAASSERRHEIEAALREELQRHARWASNCPENFQNRRALIQAEVARIEGRPLDAERDYEEAIRSARDNGFVQHEALAYELASRFYRQRGFGEIADTYLRGARACYARWGAVGKVRQLDQQHPRLVEGRPLPATATVSVGSDQLDLSSVTKASQSISGEIVLDELIRTLLRIVLEQGGAQRACLALSQGGVLSVRAEAELGAQGFVTTVLESSPVDSSPHIPRSILHYVQRTRDRVILVDAAADAGKFSGDDYFARHETRSVLCIPILKQAEVAGLLYLENNGLAGAFTADRLTALGLLATQAAISLENALLLARERAARATAEDAEHRSAFLARAGVLLSESLEYEDTLARLVRLCVESLGTWCIIDLAEGTEIRRVAFAHADPQKTPLLKELQRKYPPTWSSPHPAAACLRTGKPILIPGHNDEGIRSTCEDEDHLRIIRALGTRSSISVPLIARGAVLGALTIASGAPGHYRPADVELIQEVARRAAIAIDNARLYRKALKLSEAERRQAEAEAANRTKDQFLAMVTHELRNPLAPIQTAIYMLRSSRRPDPERQVAIIERQTRRLTRLIEDLSDVSRIGRGRLQLQRRRLEISSAITEAVEAVGPLLAECAHQLDVDVPPTGLLVDGDPGRLAQVFANLLTNAAKYTEPHGHVSVSARREAGLVVVRVQDDGIGIPPEMLPRVFDLFVQDEQALGRARGGLGIGLALVQSLILLHGGTISVESEPCKGSTFTVKLPTAIGPEVPAQDAARILH